MFRCHLQLPAHMMLAQFPQKCTILIIHQIIKPDTRTDKYFFHTRKHPQLFQQGNVILMVYFQILTWFWEQALFRRTGSLRHLLFACRCTEIRRRSPDIMDIPFKVRFLNDLFCLINDRLVASRLNNSALMKRQRTETASAKTSAVADQGKLNLPDRRNPSVFFI